MAKRMKEKNERNSSKLILNIFIVLVFLVLVGGVFYLSPNYIREDYDGKTKVLINNNNVTLKMKNDVYIDENNNVFLSLADIRNYFDKYIEYNKENGDIVTTSEINIAKMSTKNNEITINGEEEKLNSSAIEKNDTIYLPFSEISEKVYDVDLEYIQDTNTIIIDSLDRKQEVANTTKETKLKYKPQTLSGTLEKIEANEQVVYIEETNNWAEVRSKDGTIGYIKKEDLGNVEVAREAKEYIENAVTNAHLRESSEALLQLESDDATRVMGWPDDLKLRSSMTLFALAAKENEVFRRVLDKFFDGKLDAQTVDILDMRYLVMRIDEPDFGCEGRPDGVEPMAKVTLLKLKSEEEIQLEIPDAELYQKEINEGNEVAFTTVGVILKIS